MSKKKKFLGGVILTAIILAIQVYFLMSYDHFKAEGGMKVEMKIDPNDVTKGYARASLDFDYVMEDAILTHKAEGGDFLTILAESNKKRLDKRFVLLFNYKEIDELTIDSKDDEVIEFLRESLDKNLERAADIYVDKIQRAIDKAADVSYDSEELNMTIKIPGVMDSLNPELFRLPQVHLGFYECATMGNFGGYWNSACMMNLSESVDSNVREIADGITIVEVNTNVIDPSIRSLASCVAWQEYGFGIVKPTDKRYVDSVLRSEEIADLFPEEFRFTWSEKKSNINGGGDMYQLYILRIPYNGKPIISNEDIHTAEFEADGGYGEPVLSIKMTPDGTEKWKIMTEENVGRLIAMCVNGVVFSAPHVVSPIMDGNTQISSPDPEALQDIGLVLNSESVSIRPRDGRESFVKGNPPLLNATIQKILIVISVLLISFFSIGFVRNLRN